jgi:polyphosphate kinase 2 (PPK2 family)
MSLAGSHLKDAHVKRLNEGIAARQSHFDLGCKQAREKGEGIMDFRKKFVVRPGAKVRLGDIDPAYKGEHESHQTGAAELARHTASLAQLQYKLYAEDKRALLIVLQGLDAAGKDGVIRHVISGTNPQGVNVACFRLNNPHMRNSPTISFFALTIIHQQTAR